MTKITMPDAETVVEAGPVKIRAASFAPSKTSDLAVYDSGTIAFDREIEGPAVIEEKTTTILVPPGWSIRLDRCHAWYMWRE